MHPSTTIDQFLGKHAYRCPLTRNHYRIGGIDRRDAHCRTQQGRHLMLASGYREHRPALGKSLHQPPPRGHQLRRVIQRQHPGHMRGRQLPNRMAHHNIRTHTPVAQQGKQRNLYREQ
ncbi:hypothetical protein DSM43518_01401 [Mycobacterium marinum]|uniref:Uncharacterized protein n=1 Tax=Mycobacterium marinum TaxID=1781 RepID=A0A3E2MSF7_MYCMR|nr:hypothetical protein DE4381_05030 [Mycobacterium marinum]RFZ06337.1 hypothetical protein VIMS_04555 [Mycobacterium marinum]RFZ13183.1 hypothetical protein DSM43518_01401 [Mycobacterium marinum]RFZ18382.1 hypothetical protein DSM44344_05000 [Mycobacterium marinum]RFZ22777.1 hypothetical protein DSM43519_02876 [Mycobacterium marinum]